jgi:hypothetical protein
MISENGYIYVSSVLSFRECERYTAAMLALKDAGSLVNEADGRYYKNSVGIARYPDFEELLNTSTRDMTHLVGQDLKPANSYCRIYMNGSTLNKHVDRPPLDVTLSVTLHTVDHPWLLYAKDLSNTEVAFDIKRGDGALMFGRKMEHWREPLVCKDDEYVCQLFLHWSI